MVGKLYEVIYVPFRHLPDGVFYINRLHRPIFTNLESRSLRLREHTRHFLVLSILKSHHLLLVLSYPP